MTNSVQKDGEEENEVNASDTDSSVPEVTDGESQVSVRHPLDRPASNHAHVEIETSELDSEEGDLESEKSDVREVSEPSEHANKVAAQKHAKDEVEDEVLPRMLGDRYRLESLLAKGGMGRVYKATQLPLGRSVAVKVLAGSFSGLDSAYRRRFLLEASVCSSLTHPNIVVVYDYGETADGVLFMAMELIAGRRLSQVIIEDGPMPVDRGVFVALQIARALREAHRQGVAHRDLKPGNVFLTAGSDDAPDNVKVFDFGLAKIFESAPERRDMELTMDGVMMGSPRYMSPEQIRGEEVDARADIYSFGALLYMLLCGRPPFLGATSIDVLAAHIQLDPPRFADALAERGHAAPKPIPASLEALALRCLEKEPGKRYQSMDQPILELKRALANLDNGFDEGTNSGFALADLSSSATHPAIPLGVMPPARLSSGTHLGDDDSMRGDSTLTALGAPPEGRGREQSSGLTRLAIAVGIAAILAVLLAVLFPSEAEPTRTAVEAAQVGVAFSSEPPGATVYLNDVRQGVTPFDASYDSGSSQTFRFRRPGFEDELVRSEIVEGVEVRVSLREVAPAQVLPTLEQNDPPSTARPAGSTEPRDVSAMESRPTNHAPRRTGETHMRMPTSPSTRPTGSTDPVTPIAEIPERPRVVPLVEPRRLVDDSSRVPLVD